MKAANTPVTLSAPEESNTQILISSHYHTAFLVEDLLKVQASYDLQSEYTSKARQITGLVKSSLILGTPEMATLSKQEESLQLQRLSEMTSKEEAIVRTYWN